MTAYIYAKKEKEAIGYFKKLFPNLIDVSGSRFEDEWNREDWNDDYGFSVMHMGHSPKDWELDDEPFIVSCNYKIE